MLLKRGWPPMSHIWGEKRGVLMHKRYSAGHGAAGQNRARVPLISMWLTALLFITLTYLYCHVAFGDLPHVEANRGNHVFTELTRLLQNKRKKVGEKTGENAHSKKNQKQKHNVEKEQTLKQHDVSPPCLFLFLPSRRKLHFLSMSETLLNRTVWAELFASDFDCGQSHM